ncbi:putative Sensor histidine kinase [Vibrio nigripulchritudo SOn1]|uniref:histidine kinase n=2 Tax=Vibrio nigripulchritudo TaxID=28173 RepID=A0AAV2VKB7_9VIBR|nr:putative Sensor histidine kinase [Vibrio nigripulchritudo SOn1]
MQSIRQIVAYIYDSLKYLNWYHWLALGFSLALTLTAWRITFNQTQLKAQSQFQYQATQLITIVKERMSKYEEALWAGVSSLHMLDKPASRQDWAMFSNQFRIEQRLPGINGIGVIHYVPAPKLDSYLAWQKQSFPEFRLQPVREAQEYWPITYIEPASDNIEAIGLDMAHEIHRHTAAQRAMISGEASITAPIILVQDSMKTPGFLLFVPWYTNQTPPNLYGQINGPFLGLVYAPFVVNKLLQGALTDDHRLVHFSVSDEGQILYNERHSPDIASNDPPLFNQKLPLDLYGRTWLFDIDSSRLFDEQVNSSSPAFILIAGILVDFLLLFIFLLLSRQKEQAQRYAQRVTQDLNNRTQTLEQVKITLETRNHELEEANQELDQFAFVASHDLKAPLRGVVQLVSWITEDLKENAQPQIKQYLSLLQSRVTRLDKLLDDLLLYSRVGRKKMRFQTILIEDRIHELFEMMCPNKHLTLVCEDTISEMTTLTTPLDLVIRNLLGNAIKHHDKDIGTIKVTCDDVGDLYVFTVQDDGPGIPQEYHQKVFELFHTLKPRDCVEGSGIGLSLIKKTLDFYSCQYSLETNENGGCTFRFSWPNQSDLEMYNNGAGF